MCCVCVFVCCCYLPDWSVFSSRDDGSNLVGNGSNAMFFGCYSFHCNWLITLKCCNVAMFVYVMM
jgi:hypothetical protein